MNNVEQKITNLLRKEKFHLKHHLISYHQYFPWISFSEEIGGLSKDFSIYSWLDKEKDTGLLNNDKKLEEEIKRKMSSFAQSLISGLRFQLTPKICQKECYDSSNLVIKNKVDFQNLGYNDLISLFKEVDLPKDKEWICFLSIELFKLAEGKSEHFKVKKNLLQIIPLPLGNSFQIIFAEISSPLLTYRIDDLFCQENWNNIRQGHLFLVARLLYSIAEVKGRLVGITNAKPIKFQTPYLGKCQTCQKIIGEERKIWGAKRVEFSDSWYRFCSKDCIRDYDRWEALERGESIEDYLKKEQEKEVLTQQVIKEFDRRDDNSNNSTPINELNKNTTRAIKNCRRCLKPIEKIKSCGKANCPYWNPRDLNRPMIKRDLKLNLPDKYFIENLCNSCSDKLEDVLNVFYNYWTIGRTQEEFGNKNIETNAEGEHKGKYFFDTKNKLIKIWEGNNIREFDLRKENLENILNSMNF